MCRRSDTQEDPVSPPEPEHNTAGGRLTSPHLFRVFLAPLPVGA